MSWIDKILPSGISRSEGNKRASVPEGVWTKCIACEAVLYGPDLERNANVCPKCDHHMRLGARQRLDMFLDKEGREEVFTEIEPIDRLRFRDKKKYVARLAAAQKSTGERDALVAIRGTLHGLPVVVVAFEFGFHGGSMGQAVGEKFSQAAQLALRERVPLVCFAASGGARMQEALISLMQMAKTSAVIERMHTEGVPYISVMTDPIYGGVSASLALLGDLNIAEPEARAGFAGPNIIEQTIRQKLPKGFQRSEFLLEHGAIDMIVPRLELRDTIAGILAKLLGEDPVVKTEPEVVMEGEETVEAPDAAPAEPVEPVLEAVADEPVAEVLEPADGVEAPLETAGAPADFADAEVVDMAEDVGISDETVAEVDESAVLDTADAAGQEVEEPAVDAAAEAVVDDGIEEDDKKSKKKKKNKNKAEDADTETNGEPVAKNSDG